MDTPTPPANEAQSRVGAPPPLPSADAASNGVSTQKPLTPEEKKAGLGCLAMLVVGIILLVGYCGSKNDDSSDSVPVEEKIAFLDGGEASSKDAEVVAEYKKHLEILADRFEISGKEVANITYSSVQSVKSAGGQTTTLEMLRAARTAALSSSGASWGKGKSNYAYLVASIAAQKVPQ